MRAEFQVLVIPYIKDTNGNIQYLIFKRSDLGSWQFIAGGGEDNEKPSDAAKREAREEAGIVSEKILQLKTTTSIPIYHFSAHANKKGLYVIPEYSFATEIQNKHPNISKEHAEYKCVSYEEALLLLSYDGNKTALWELNERLKAADF